MGKEKIQPEIKKTIVSTEMGPDFQIWEVLDYENMDDVTQAVIDDGEYSMIMIIWPHTPIEYHWYAQRDEVGWWDREIRG